MPLELIHSDVWGPAIASSGGFKYYVRFIDDYLRFCWIYLLKHKSNVEQVFYAFQAHVKRLLDAKIKSALTGVVNTTNCIAIFSSRVSLTVCLVLTPLSKTASLNASTTTLLKPILLYLFTPPCHCAIGMQPFLPRVISLTACPRRCSKRTHWCITFSVSSPTTIFSVLLDVRVGLVFASIMLINLHFGLSSVSF
jgi:hypothetical protein